VGGWGAVAPQDGGDGEGGGATAGGDGCVPTVRSASGTEGDGDRSAAIARRRDVKGGHDVRPKDGGTVRDGLERRAMAVAPADGDRVWGGNPGRRRWF
jgi:hypothetical protein